METKPSGSLTDRVTERLRRAIIEGEFALGAALSEEKIAQTLGVSRSPVRNAFTALQQQGLIDVQPQRGSFVFQPSREDTAHLCEFRRMIEIDALALAMNRNRKRAVTALSKARNSMARALAIGDAKASARADDEFHDAIINCSGNPYLINAYRLFSGKVAALRSHQSDAAMRGTANEEHAAIIALVEGGDLDGASQALSVHILKMAERYSIDAAHPAGGRAARTPVLDRFELGQD